MKFLVIFIAFAFLLIFLLIKLYTIYKRQKLNPKLSVGMKAPDFSLKNQDNQVVRLSDYAGKKLVIYFYPKDDTPSCTIEAEGLRDAQGSYQEKGINVLGISYDSPESHKKFQEKYHLPFTLLSDENKRVAEAYGAAGPMGNIVSKRVTFLIDETGKIIKILENFDVNLHAQQILDYFK